MTRYRVRLHNEALGSLERIVTAERPSAALMALARLAFAGMDQVFEQALIDHEVRFAIEPIAVERAS